MLEPCRLQGLLRAAPGFAQADVLGGVMLVVVGGRKVGASSNGISFA